MKEKIEYFIQKLNTLPDCKNDDFYRIADYIELKCLTNKDGLYSIADFLDDAKQRAEDLGEGDFEENFKMRDLGNARKNDKWEIIATDSFRVIESRTKLFGDYYPFILSKNGKNLSLKDRLGDEKLYIFLLLCSDLRYTIKFKKELTSSFEHACLEVSKKITPGAVFHLFGSSNTENVDSPWKTGKLWDKLKGLETFLVEELRVKENDLSKNNMGDGGIDIVGKIDLGDNLPNTPIFLDNVHVALMIGSKNKIL